MLDTLIQAENSHKPHPHFNGFQKIQAATMKPLGLKQPLYADQVHQSRLTPTGVTNKMYLKKKTLYQPTQTIIFKLSSTTVHIFRRSNKLTFPDAAQPRNN